MGNNAITATFGLDLSAAQKSLSKVKQMGSDVKSAFKFEGLEGEKRVERNLGALVGELGRAQSATDALSIAADRLENSFKSSLGIGVAVGAGIALKKSLEQAASAAGELFDGYQKLSQQNIGAQSVEDLDKVKSGLEALKQKTEQEIQNGGLLTKFIYGSSMRAQVDVINADIDNIAKKVEKFQQQADQKKASFLQGDVEINDLKLLGDIGERAAETANIQLKYDRQIAELNPKINALEIAKLQTLSAQEVALARMKFNKEDEKKALDQQKKDEDDLKKKIEERDKFLEEEKALKKEIAQLERSKLPVEQQLLEVQKKKAQIEKVLVNFSGEGKLKLQKEAFELAKEETKLLDEKKKKEEEILDLKKKQGEAEKDKAKAEEDLKTGDKDRSARTLGELAEGKGTLRQKRQARRVLKREERARKLQDRGKDDEAAEERKKADEIRGGIQNLKSDEKDPLKGLKQALSGTEAKLDEIKAQLKGMFISQ